MLGGTGQSTISLSSMQCLQSMSSTTVSTGSVSTAVQSQFSFEDVRPQHEFTLKFKFNHKSISGTIRRQQEPTTELSANERNR
uniref:Uncharacterized protein n=1 Tax=Onchocerca volvulus TaxID=6282 RepID=A0A8R1TNG3_ONCVO